MPLAGPGSVRAARSFLVASLAIACAHAPQPVGPEVHDLDIRGNRALRARRHGPRVSRPRRRGRAADVRIESREQETADEASAAEKSTGVEVCNLSSRIYVSYAHVFGAQETQNRNEAHHEYRLARRWILQSVFGDAGVGGLDALWTYRY